MKDVTAPVPQKPPGEVREAASAVGLTVLGGVFILIVLLFASAMLGFLFHHAAWLLVLAVIGWPVVRLMHVTGRWIIKNLHI